MAGGIDPGCLRSALSDCSWLLVPPFALSSSQNSLFSALPNTHTPPLPLAPSQLSLRVRGTEER